MMILNDAICTTSGENFLLIIRRVEKNANNNTLIYFHNSFL